MRSFLSLLIIATALTSPTLEPPTSDVGQATPQWTDEDIANDLACDSKSFLEFAVQAEKLREERRLDAETFDKFSKDAKTIILDARSSTAFEHLHMQGAINLPYTAFSAGALAHTIPDKSTRILIYCRNNLSLPSETITVGLGTGLVPTADLDIRFEKAVFAGLNIPTYITLYSYGYHNVWELESIVDPVNGPLKFVGKSLEESRSP